MSLPGRGRAVFLAAFLATCMAGCLERNNPFDPLNQTSPLIPEIRNRNRATLDSLVLAGLETANGLDGLLDGYRDDSVRNARTADTNAAWQAANLKRAEENESTGTANARAPVSDSLRYKVRFQLLETVVRLGPYPSLESKWDQLKNLEIQALAVMTQANEDARPIEVYPPAYRDSVLGSLRRDIAAFATLRALVEAANREVDRANEGIRTYNLDMENQNRYVDAYNSEIAFRRESRNRVILTHPDSLLNATQRARAGDTLFLGPGTFPVDLRFASGNPVNPIVIRGYPGEKTILRPPGAGGAQAGIIRASHLLFQDLVFRGGSTSGIKVEGGSRDVAFERCVFDSNGTWGLDAAGSDISMKDCEVRANGNGMRLAMDNCFDCNISLENVLVARNLGVGIEAVGTNGRINKSTIADNGADGLMITNHNRNLNIAYSIFSGNGKYGLTRDATFYYLVGLNVESTNFWENGETGDRHWSLANVDSNLARIIMDRTLYLDPGFKDPPAFEYDPRPDSRLTDFEKTPPFPIIGYRRPKP